VSNEPADLPSGVRRLGDFSLGPRVLAIIAAAIPIGALSACVAFCLLRLIGLITNLVFYGRAQTSLVAPGAHAHSPLLILGAPIAGGLVVGLMARFGSEKIRGHGMPEAIESILVGGSKVQPRVALLKPISAAISIGTGGPFGAEGPIIMTGGAVGSLLAQFLDLTADERKALLVAGAAGGMAATFNAPLASILLAVELLLFEWRPRSYLPVAASVAVATIVRGASSEPRRCSPSTPVRCISTRRCICCARPPVCSEVCSRSRRPGSSIRPRTRSSGCRSTGCGGRRSVG
jgi:H+/Cl- antiporter ClcA